MDQCANPYRQLRQCRHCIYSGGPANRYNCWAYDHRQYDEKECYPLQVSKNGGDTGLCFGHLF